jgi:hypothetical protein
MEKLKALADDLRRMKLHPGKVTAGFREAFDAWLRLELSGLERDDGNSLCMLKDGPREARALQGDHAWIGLDQLRRDHRQILRASVGKPGIDRQVPPLDISEVTQVFQQRWQGGRRQELRGLCTHAKVAEHD